MILLLDSVILILLLIGMVMFVSWLAEAGVQDIIIYTEHFLLEETKKLRVSVLPEIHSTKLWDKLELSLYYSGIRSYLPFISAKVWIIFSMIIMCCTFIIAVSWSKRVWQAGVVCIAVCIIMTQILEITRRANLRATERYLLELLNVTESFAVTGEEPIAILSNCAVYMKGPIGQALNSVDKYVKQGWSGRMILEQLKVRLEHPKWQEFIHNLNICSMYNSEYSFVFRTSRKSIQAYLTSKKERQSIKHTAEAEMAVIVFLSLIIILVLSKFLAVSVGELMWGNGVSRGCTIYMVGIVMLFFWKISVYEKE